jgi:GNAT superfamily N-acetyltransferase
VTDAVGELLFRRPVEADYPRVVTVIDEWWGGRSVRRMLPRLWFQHFAGHSWIAETADGRLMGFLVGFLSPDRPGVAYIHFVGTNPNLRKRGLGRALYERFFDDARAAGAERVQAVTWPGNRISINFHKAMGFTPDDGPGTQNLYGIPAYADYDGNGDDRVVFSRAL